jgi:hypothetical protein
MEKIVELREMTLQFQKTWKLKKIRDQLLGLDGWIAFPFFSFFRVWWQMLVVFHWFCR